MNFFLTIILACVAYFCVRAVWRSLKSDARSHGRLNAAARDAAFQTLSEGSFRYPTWTNDSAMRSMFIKRVDEQLRGKVPDQELSEMIKVQWFQGTALTIADAYETRGYKFSEQIVLTSDVLKEVFDKGLYKRFKQSELQEPNGKNKNASSEGKVQMPVPKASNTEMELPAKNAAKSMQDRVADWAESKSRNRAETGHTAQRRAQNANNVEIDRSQENVPKTMHDRLVEWAESKSHPRAGSDRTKDGK